MTQSTDIHAPDSTAPVVTGRVAKCRVCGVQWQVQSEDNTDAQACQFCGAGPTAIAIINEDD